MMVDQLNNCGLLRNSVSRVPLSERVYESIRLSIMKGDLLPGQRLTEAEVSARLEVSATPVREAFRKLAAEDLITIIPWRGIVIKRIAEKDMIDAYICREALEGMSCRLAAANIDDAGIERLWVLHSASARATSVSELVDFNSQIHNLILDYADNKKLSSLLGLFWDVILHDRNMTAYSDRRRREIELEHVDIIEALSQRSGDSAEMAMRRHVKNGLAALMVTFDEK